MSLLNSRESSGANGALLNPAAAGNGQPGDFTGLAVKLERSLDSLCASVLERYGERLQVPAGGPAPIAAEIVELTREGLVAELRSFRLGVLPERCPVFVAGLARAAAGAGQLEVLRSGHRIVHAVLWDAWFELVEGHAEIDPEGRRELLRRGSGFFFRYADLLGDFLAEAYRRELEQLSASTEQRRFRAIKGLLDGDPLAASSLDFDLDRHHLGLIAWGGDPLATARELAAALGRPLLAISPLQRERSCWAWISGVRALEPAEEWVLKSFEPSAGRIALGLEAFGEEGFRASHRQASRARRFATEPGPALLRYEDIVVEALASENEDDARAFVAHELRGIEDDSPASRRIRETLAAYFASEYNATSAGAALGIHQQTVANRVRAAEERLGQKSIGARRVELEMALRLREILVAGDQA